MCQSQPGVNATRELKLGGGLIVQCLACRRVGVEFGTSYLTFDEEGFLQFARWFDRLDATSPTERGRFRIQVQGECGIMLSLAPGELRSLAELLQQGIRWLTDGSVGSPREPRAAVETGGWVH